MDEHYDIIIIGTPQILPGDTNRRSHLLRSCNNSRSKVGIQTRISSPRSRWSRLTHSRVMIEILKSVGVGLCNYAALSTNNLTTKHFGYAMPRQGSANSASLPSSPATSSL